MLSTYSVGGYYPAPLGALVKIKLWVHPNTMFEIILKSSNHFHNALPLTYRLSFPKLSNHASGVTMDTHNMIWMYWDLFSTLL